MIDLNDEIEKLLSKISQLEEENSRLKKDAFEKSEEQYYQILEAVPNAIIIQSEGEIVFLNTFGLKLVGATDPGQLLGMSIFDLIHPHFREIARQRSYHIVHDQQQSPFMEMLLVHLDGSFSYCEVSGIPIVFQGRSAVLGIFHDISKRKAAENALKTSEERYRRLVENSPDASIIHTDGEIVYVNPAGVKILKASSSEELIGKAISEILHPDYRESSRERVIQALSTMKIAPFKEVDFLGLDGTTIPTEATAIPFKDQNGLSIQTLFRDISRRKQAQEERRLNQSILDNLSEGVFLLNEKEKTFIYTNPAFEKMLGYKAGELLGKSVNLINPTGLALPADKLEMIASQIRNEGKWLGDFENIKKDGSQISTSTSITSFEHSKFGTVRVSIKRDITEQKKLETQLRQAQKLEALGTLAGGIAHEFNNLLAPILGFTELLLEEKSEQDSDRDSLVQIMEAGQRAKDLVKQVLAYGRKSLSVRVPVRLESIIENNVQLLKNTIASNIVIRKKIENNVPPVLGMPNEIHQVLLNLCLNATHAMPEGGELTITLSQSGFRHFKNPEGTQRIGNFICLCVEDTGVGMDQATLERIYDPFFTTKEVGVGTGLGLSVVLGIVEQHRGQIEVNSSIGTVGPDGHVHGAGTTFQVFFPVSEIDFKTTSAATEEVSRGNENILLVDDESMIVNLGRRMLEKLGYKVTVFSDCTEALQHFANDPFHFDLAVTDYGMPLMNGKQMGKRLKEIRGDIPIILLTGYGDLAAKEEIQSWGIEALLMKPFTMNELSKVIKEVLDK
ncbi:MAG: PAS domain S-box protein [SAR324 cluster bacterium]|nr:PAS domain S-box protein [SAR324 cluster bacterium]